MKQVTFEQIRKALMASHQAIGGLMDVMTLPRTGSVAELDIGFGGEYAKATRTLMELAIVAAADHMAALERELTEPVMTYSPWTTARGVLENASIAMWLLEDMDSRHRLARGLTLRLAFLQDESVFVRDARKRRPDIESFTQAIPDVNGRIRHLRKVAVQFGITEKCNRRGRLVGFEETLPSSTELADGAFREGGTYRFLSAVAHNRVWATMAASLRTGSTEGAVEQQMTLSAALFLISSAIDWFARPVWAYFKYNGWDLSQLARVLENSYDQTAQVGGHRFWRADIRSC